MKQAVDFSQEMRDVVAGDIARIVLQQVINANKEIGNRVQPCEPGVLLEQFDQHLDGFHGSTHAFIRLLLGKDEGTVKPDEAFPDRQHCSTPWIHGNQRRRVRGRSHMSSVAGLYESASGLDADIKTDAFVS